MIKVVGWRIWYADSFVCDSTMMDWRDAPNEGVILVMLYYDKVSKGGTRYRHIMKGSDWYFHVGDIYGQGKGSHEGWGKWLSPDPILAQYPDAELKRGLWTDDVTMERARAAGLRSVWP